MPKLAVVGDDLPGGQIKPVGDVALEAGHRPRFGLQITVGGTFAARTIRFVYSDVQLMVAWRRAW